ncbi:hypothetical protein LINPERPRIM_LOCUS38116 [Linum perenne]
MRASVGWAVKLVLPSTNSSEMGLMLRST